MRTEKINNHKNDLDKSTKKKYGRFYTDDTLANLIVNNYEIKKDNKILEPGCGLGSFILPLFNKISNFHKGNLKEKIFSNHIYAIDNDERAVETLRKLFNIASTNEGLVTDDFLTYDKFKEKYFDLIIGNPPYAAILPRDLLNYVRKRFRNIIVNRVETSALFMAKSISLLKEGGNLAFIMPSTLLRVHTYEKLREYIKKECYIEKIWNLGMRFKDVGYETVVIFIKKKDINVNKPKIFCTAEINKNNERKNIRSLSYDYIEKRDIIPLYLDNNLHNIIKQIEKNCVPLAKISEIKRGVSINATDTKKLTDKKNNEVIRVYRGKDIGRYLIKKPSLFLKKEFIDANLLKQYEDKKILVQNLAYRIVAAYDDMGLFCLDTLSLVRIINRHHRYKYILAILNSKLMEFYFQNVISNRARLNIHMDGPYLGKLPIKEIDKYAQENICKRVDKLIEKFDWKTRNEIEKMIFDIYCVKNKGLVEENTLYWRGNDNKGR